MYIYQDFIEEWIKQGDQWSRFIPHRGSPIYPADLNTIQSIINSQVSNVLGSIYKSGTIIRGADIIVRGDVCEVTPGLFHLEGMLIKTPSLTFTINPLDNYTIYLHIDESRNLLDSTTTSQSSMRDLLLTPSQGTQTISITSRLVVNDPSPFIVGSISLGIATSNKTDYLSPITSLLALSNYERYGNFIVKGLQPSVLNSNSTYSINTPLPASIIDASRLYIKNLEEALRDSIQAQTLIGNQMYISVSQFNTQGDIGLGNDIQLLRTSFDSASRNVEFFRTELKKAYDNLNKNTPAISRFVKDIISITPGVGYIEGHRISIPTSTSISIERDLSEQLIENAKYEITEGDNTVYRSLQLDDKYRFEDLLTFYTELYITIDNLELNGKTGSGRVVCVINSALPDYITSIQLLLDFITSEIVFTPYNHPNIRFDSLSGTIEAGMGVRNAINKSLELERVGSNTIAIKSSDNTLIAISTSTNSTLIRWDKDRSYLGNTLTNNNYKLSFTPVTRIKSLVADMQKRNEPIIRSNGDRDILPDNTIFDIDIVTQGGIKFLPGIDYELVGTNTIRWLFNTSPSNGTMYYVSYTYTQPLVENEDFILSKIDNSIRFINKVPSGGTFTIDYFYALNKKGYVYLNSNGNFTTQVHNHNEESIPTTPSSALLITTFDITPNGIQLIPTSINRVITPELVSLLEERIRVLEEDVFTLLAKYSIPENTEAILSQVDTFTTINPNPRDDYSYNILLGGITPTNKAITTALQYTNGAQVYSDRLFGSRSKYTSLLSESSYVWDPDLLSETTPITIYPITTPIKQPVLVASIDRVSSLDPLESKLSLLDAYPFTITKDTYTLGSSIYLDSIYKDLTRQLGKFLTSIKDAIEYGAFNSLLLPSSYFMDSFINESKASGVTIKVIGINFPTNSSGINVRLNGTSVNEATIPLGNTSKDINNLLSSDTNGYLTFELQLSSIKLGTHTLELVRGNDILAANTIVLPANLLIGGINQAFSSWNQAINTSLTTRYPINSRSAGSLITINPDSYVPLNRDVIHASDESVIQFFSPTQDVVIEGIAISIRSFDPRVRIIGVIKEAVLDSEYHINSYKTTENIVGLLTTNEIQSGDDPTELRLTTPTPLYRGCTYGVCLFVYNSWVELNSYEFQYPLPLINLKGCLTRSGVERNAYNLSTNIHMSLMHLTFPKNIQNDIYLGTYGIENNTVPITHFCLNSYPILPSGTSLQFQYYDGSSWKACFPNHVVPLPTALQTIQLRAIGKTANELTTPIVSLDESSITLYTPSNKLVYTSQKVPIRETYTRVEVLVEYMDDPYITYSIQVGSDLDDIWFDTKLLPSSITNLDTTGLFKQAMFSYTTKPSETLRNSITYKVTGVTTNLTRTPCIRKATLYVYP